MPDPAFGYAQLTRFASGPSGALRVAALAFALTLPAIAIGLAADDFGGAVALDAALPPSDLRPVVLINAPSHLPVHFLGAMRAWRGKPSAAVDLLYAGSAPVQLHRPSEGSLVLSVERGYFASTFERIERDPRRRPMRAGDVIELPRLRGHVLAARDGSPTEVRFDFDRTRRGSTHGSVGRHGPSRCPRLAIARRCLGSRRCELAVLGPCVIRPATP